MAKFILTKCKLREGWLVPKKGEMPVQVDWQGLCEKLAPSNSPQAKRALRMGIGVNSFVGLLRQPSGQVTNFVIRNINLSGDVRSIVQRDPNFPARLVDAYRIDLADWDDAVLEATTSTTSLV